MSYFCPAMTAFHLNLVDLLQLDGFCYSGFIQTSESNGKLILEMTAFLGITWEYVTNFCTHWEVEENSHSSLHFTVPIPTLSV